MWGLWEDHWYRVLQGSLIWGFWGALMWGVQRVPNSRFLGGP